MGTAALGGSFGGFHFAGKKAAKSAQAKLELSQQENQVEYNKMVELEAKLHKDNEEIEKLTKETAEVKKEI